MEGRAQKLRANWNGSVLATTAFAFLSAVPVWSGNGPVIESIEGDKVVVVKTPKGNRVGTRGTEIEFGDRVKTGPHASAKIRYPDGSKLLIGRATEMEVQKNENGVQWNELHSGEIRGIIKKPDVPQENRPDGKKPLPRFIVRTRSAVMGVRGTDFVYNVDETAARSQVHTLDGVVEVAKDEPTLLDGKGVEVYRDQYVTADPAKIEPPKSFDRDTYVSRLEQQQPEFVALTKNDPDAYSHDEVQPERRPEPERKRLSILSFQLNPIYLKQASGGEMYSAQASWNPGLRLFGPFSIRGHLGFFPIKGRTTDKKLTAMQIGVLASVSLLEPLIIEIGAGNETWSGQSRSGPLGMFNLAWRMSHEDLIERIFIGYSSFDQHVSNRWGSYKNKVDQFKAGIGVRF